MKWVFDHRSEKNWSETVGEGDVDVKNWSETVEEGDIDMHTHHEGCSACSLTLNVDVISSKRRNFKNFLKLANIVIYVINIRKMQ